METIGELEVFREKGKGWVGLIESSKEDEHDQITLYVCMEMPQWSLLLGPINIH
jgi:hypothetical protein